MIEKCCALLLACCLLVGFNVNPLNELKHDINIIHKGISPNEPVACTLIEIQNEEKKPHEYYMDVESVVCGDSQCRIDIVRIYWDKIGRFSRLELPDGIHLEKAEGERFNEKDYKKLDRILNDPNSSLEDVYKYEVVSTLGSEGVDALSGATVLLDKSTYVAGAVWTCYSLWHWVHGDAKSIARDITGDALTTSELISFLSEEGYEEFAIEQLIRKQDYSEAICNSILKTIEAKPALLKVSLPYFESAPEEIFRSSICKLVKSPVSNFRLIVLKALNKSNQSINTDLITEMDLEFTKLSYQEVHELINILEYKHVTSVGICDSLSTLLAQNNFIIARKVYWYLQSNTECKHLNKLLTQFQNKWNNKL